MFLNRKIFTRLDLMTPSNSNSNAYYENTDISKTFSCGERVACRNYSGSEKWKFGIVSARKGKLHYTIRLDDGRSWERHVDQMRKIGKDTPTSRPENDHYYWDLEKPWVPVHPNSSLNSDTEKLPDVPENAAPVSSQTDKDIDKGAVIEVQRRSARARRRPDFFSECTAK